MNLTIDPIAGLVYGPRGVPYRKRIKGYVTVHKPGGVYYACVHRLVWEYVHGPIPRDMQINHINGIKHDNRIENLELVTASENTKHAYRMGLARADGEHNGRHKGKLRRERFTLAKEAA